jgi:hypothetical protein
MRITEVLDRPAPIDLIKSNSSHVRFLAKIPNEQTGVTDDMIIEFFHEDRYINLNIWEAIFERGEETKMTGAGNAKLVFATFLTSVAAFTRLQSPEWIYWTADIKEQSRVRMYRRMADRLPPGYTNVSRMPSKWPVALLKDSQLGANKVEYTVLVKDGSF